MARKQQTRLLPITLLALLLVLPAVVLSHDKKPNQNCSKKHHRGGGAPKGGGGVDDALAKAEESTVVIRVCQKGTGNFTSIAKAIESIPKGNSQRVIVSIDGGVYKERITIDKSKPFVTLYGSPENMPKITFDSTLSPPGSNCSATLSVDSDYFMAVNLDIESTGSNAKGESPGAPSSSDVALRVAGDKAAFHNCKFRGAQNAILDDIGKHFFKDCFILGNIDFIFRNGRSVYLNSELCPIAKGMRVITGQAIKSLEDNKNGFTFINCNITGSGEIDLSGLGKATAEAAAVFANTYIDASFRNNVHGSIPGLSDSPLTQSFGVASHGEYKCSGPGASKGAKALGFDEVKPFLSKAYLHAGRWLLQPPKLF